jgi:hypothetical protein
VCHAPQQEPVPADLQLGCRLSNHSSPAVSLTADRGTPDH